MFKADVYPHETNDTGNPKKHCVDLSYDEVLP